MIENVITASVALELARARGRTTATLADHREARNLVRAWDHGDVGIVVGQFGLAFLDLPDDLDDGGKLAVWLALDAPHPASIGAPPEAIPLHRKGGAA
jgi:hypothetical protein